VPPPPLIDKEARDAKLTAARSAEKRKAYSEALQLYQQALSHDQTNHTLMNNVASIYLRLGEHAAALAMTDKALRRAPEYVPALINQGIARNDLGNTAGAAENFARALELEPSNRDALFNLALFNEKNGKLDAAATIFQRLAGSGDLQGMFGLARIYEKRMQRSEAIRVYSDIMAMHDLPTVLRNSAAERLRHLRDERFQVRKSVPQQTGGNEAEQQNYEKQQQILHVVP
jgi:tetratricopeptide (TPR) repeat protein